MISRLTAFASDLVRNTSAWPTLGSRTLLVLTWALIATGLLSRLSPLFDPDGRLFWQYMTEDGYLMQTVARNMAIGLGMSTAEGTLPTNGVQPLATFLFAGMHFLAGGSKLAGIGFVTALSAAVAAAAAYLLSRVGSQVLAGLQHGREVSALSAALWFAAPKIVDHSMNGLETGVYYLAILSTLYYYLSATVHGQLAMSWAQRIGLGVFLGLVFLARNDAVFFIAALLLAHLTLGREAGGGMRVRFVDCLVAGVVSILVGSPWLINNYALFGSIVPISGLSESHDIVIGQNLSHVPSNLFEAAFLYAPVPGSIGASAPVIVISLVALAFSIGGFWLVGQHLALGTRRFMLTAVVFMTGIVVYYGLFFGVEFFLPRYLSALSPFLWTAPACTAYAALVLLFRHPGTVRTAATVLVMIMLAEAMAFAWMDFSRGRTHMHKQVVDWVARNVPAGTWIGAIQTGTLGFFYDRTINLDGKVNPDAMRARMREGHVLDYVVDSKIDYLADWTGITGWMARSESPRFARTFTVVVNDPQLNLGVLRRVRPGE